VIGAITVGALSSTPPTPPGPVAGYNLWLDAADPTVFAYSSGTLVSQWTDKSANAYIFNEGTTTQQPTRNTTMNGKDTVNFGTASRTDKLTSTLSSSVWKYLSNGSGATLFIVSRQQSGSNVICGTARTNSEIGIQVFNGGTSYYSGMESSNATAGQYLAAYAQTGIGVLNTPFIATFVMDQNNGTVAQRLRAYLNDGTVQTQQNGSGGTGNAGNPTYTLRFGASGIATSPLIGEIAEVISYTSILSTTDRDANISYLKTKWGI
jgi:hypothetical protein